MLMRWEAYQHNALRLPGGVAALVRAAFDWLADINYKIVSYFSARSLFCSELHSEIEFSVSCSSILSTSIMLLTIFLFDILLITHDGR